MSRSRRIIGATVAAVLLIAIAGGVYFVVRPPALRAPPTPAAPGGPELRLLAPAPPGTAVRDARVTTVYALRDGAVQILLTAADGKTFPVDILRRDDQGPAPVAATKRLALYLVTEAPGASTPEDRGLAVMALADALRKDETAPLPIALLTFRERAARFPDESQLAPAPPPAGGNR